MKCKICGKPAGFLSREHAICRKAVEMGKEHLAACLARTYENRDCMNIVDVINDTIKRTMIPGEELCQQLIDGWMGLVKQAVSDSQMDERMATFLKALFRTLELTDTMIRKSKGYAKYREFGQKFFYRTVGTALKNEQFETLQADLDTIAALFCQTPEEFKVHILFCWKNYLDEVLKDSVIEERETKNLDLIATLSPLITGADFAPYMPRLAKTFAIQELKEGKIPKRCVVSGDLPVMLKKGEEIIWLFENVVAYKNHVRVERSTRGDGYSHPLIGNLTTHSTKYTTSEKEVTEMVPLGSGYFIVTNRTLYWVAASHSIKIPITAIVTVLPFDRGIILQQEGSDRKLFQVDDPPFACELIRNLHNLP